MARTYRASGHARAAVHGCLPAAGARGAAAESSVPMALQKAKFGHRHQLIAGDDEVVDDAHVDQRQRGL